ncbi:hypothetical protein FACS1894191_7630 [Clostridia bacterium]|nr:hypothetical protein FACS1894191_7630 [Clostridia bacterium]
MVEVVDFSLRYPAAGDWAVRGASLSVRDGEFVVLCGDSGSGKTTLLRSLVRAVAPVGETRGYIKIDGARISDIQPKQYAQTVGFLSQSAENQIVADKVWHELAFGMESLGFPTAKIRARAAETAAYFGITDWYDRETGTLSGGQKQILCLASVMTLAPKILILDEPLSQLDPVCVDRYLDMLAKLNRDKGITIIMAEHNLEAVWSLGCRFVLMAGGSLSGDISPYMDSLPAVPRLARTLGLPSDSPAAFRQAFLRRYAVRPREDAPENGKAYLSVKGLFFRYGRENGMALRDINLSFSKKTTSLVGANGSGKSTLLSCLAGRKLREGKIKTERRIAMLPQDVQTIFTEKTVWADLENAALRGCAGDIGQVVERLGIRDYLGAHPFDLSGGEQQLIAFAKILLLEADVILLDEPTKGMSERFKNRIREEISRSDKRFIISSHDLEFCARASQEMIMLFRGEVIAQGPPHEILLDNRYYTTPLARLLGGECGGNLLYEEVLASCEEK